MARFVGRTSEFAELDAELGRARTGAGSLVTVRGRRQVGKSTLVQEWLNRRQLQHVFFTASGKARDEELGVFREEIGKSPMPVTVPSGITFQTWEAALELLAAQAKAARPVVIVLDELPYLVEKDPAEEKALQKIWDRVLSKKPVMLILVGSDLSMMEALGAYGRALYHRTTREMVIEPLNPADVAALLGLGPRDAFEASLVTGGFPGIMRDWAHGISRQQFLEAQLSRSSSDLVVTGERVMNAEFPATVHARLVLEAIGLGERTFSGIRQRVNISQVQLTRALKTLTERKRIAAVLQPYSARPAAEPRYVVADPYLRFWLRFIREAVDEISRGQGDLVRARIEQEWSSYCGKAVEPLIREAVMRLALRDPRRFWGAKYVGGWWNRTNSIEVDLVGGTTKSTARRVSFLGSIKWGANRFRRQDLAVLVGQRQHVPGAADATPLVAVATGSIDARGDLDLGPADLLSAWRS